MHGFKVSRHRCFTSTVYGLLAGLGRDTLPTGVGGCYGIAPCIVQRLHILAGQLRRIPLCGDSLTAKRSIKAKLGGNCLRCCHTVPVLPIGQQVLYFLPYGQWVGIRSRRALLGNHLWHSGRVKPRGMQFHFLSGGYCSKLPFGSCKR